RPGGGKQNLEYTELLASEIHRSITPMYRAFRRIEPNLRSSQQRWCRRRGAPAQRPHASGQLRKGEWFGEVVVRSEREPLDPVLDITAGGEHQHPAELTGPYDLLAQRVAGHPGKVPVQHRHVVTGDRHLLVPVVAIV